MFKPIKDSQHLTPGARIKHKDSEEYLELGDFSIEENAYFVFPEGATGSFSKNDNLGFGITEENLNEYYLVEVTDVGFYDEGEGSARIDV